MTAHDLWAMKRLGAPALSPNGQTVVFTVQEWSVEKNKATANLWLAEVAGALLAAGLGAWLFSGGAKAKDQAAAP